MSLILPYVHFTEDYRCYKVGQRIIFRDNLTVITGENGSGKSTLLSCIRELGKSKWTMSSQRDSENKIEQVMPKDTEIAYLDLSSDLYKGSPEFDFDNMALYLKCMKSSSGEGAIYQMVKFLETQTDKSLIILDEPERGLSIRKQIALSKAIADYISQNPEQQILITTHSPEFMVLAEEVYSLSHRGFVTPDTYLSWMRNE